MMRKVRAAGEVDLAEAVRVNDEWWAGSLGRPLFRFTVWPPRDPSDRPPSRPAAYPELEPARIIDREFAEINRAGYLGDGFPMLWLDFGPGALATMVGGEGRFTTETVWFEPGSFAGLELEQMHIRFRPESAWARRIAALYREAAARSRELPLVLGMTDLGGTLDVLASLRGSEQLLTDLVDRPEAVKRLLAEETAAWQEAYRHFDVIIRTGSVRAASCWAGIMAGDSCYMLQSDFAYMISPAMFDEFVRPELARNCAMLGHGFYHLDGKGQLGHIPSLAAIPNLCGIQWIPGDGQPDQCDWPEVLAEIEERGLKLQILGSLENAEKCLRQLRHPERAHVNVGIAPGQVERACRLMADYGF